MINRKILFMTIFSLAAHLAVAAVIVYAPYDITGNSMAGHQDKVIWGYIAGGGEKSAKDGKRDSASIGPQRMTKIPLTPPFSKGEIDIPLLGKIENSFPPLERGGTESVLADDKIEETGITSVQSDGSDTGDMNNGNQGSNSYDIHATAEYIREEIERHKYYPDIARLRGDEGTVYINFYIGQDGIPSSIYVARSSGSGILDDAGIKTVRMVGKISNLHKELRELDIVVPITYKLVE